MKNIRKLAKVVILFLIVVGFILITCPLRFAIIKNNLMLIEIAKTQNSRQKGLQNRAELNDCQGMLFVFEKEKQLSFWMKDTKIPLSIAFLNNNKEIVDIQQMQSMSREVHYSSKPARYALEMNAGWFKKRKISLGDRIIF